MLSYFSNVSAFHIPALKTAGYGKGYRSAHIRLLYKHVIIYKTIDDILKPTWYTMLHFTYAYTVCSSFQCSAISTLSTRSAVEIFLRRYT